MSVSGQLVRMPRRDNTAELGFCFTFYRKSFVHASFFQFGLVGPLPGLTWLERNYEKAFKKVALIQVLVEPSTGVDSMDEGQRDPQSDLCNTVVF